MFGFSGEVWWELELEPVEPGEQKPPEHTCPTKLLESD